MTAVLARAYPAGLKDPVSADLLERLPAIGLKDDALAGPPTSVHSTVEAVALILTATSSWVANTSLLWPGGLGIAVLAIAQMGIHLVFFLHITGGPDGINDILALPSVCSSCSWWSPLDVDHGRSERQYADAVRPT